MNIPRTMKAVVLAAHDRLEVVQLPVPEPGPGEALCRIRSVAICGSDPKMIRGHYQDVNWPPFFPLVMGTSGPARRTAAAESAATAFRGTVRSA